MSNLLLLLVLLFPAFPFGLAPAFVLVANPSRSCGTCRRRQAWQVHGAGADRRTRGENELSDFIVSERSEKMRLVIYRVGMVYRERSKRADALQRFASGSRLFATRQTLSAEALRKARRIPVTVYMHVIPSHLMVEQKVSQSIQILLPHNYLVML